MYANNTAEYTEYSFNMDGDAAHDEYKSIREDITNAMRAMGCHIEFDVTMSDGRELSGALISSDINYPHFRTNDGDQGFFALHDEKDSHVLFQKNWEGESAKSIYKYRITDLTLRAYHFEHPTCPSCGAAMEYGMGKEYETREEVPVSSWFCPKEVPFSYEKGIK